MLKKSRLQLFIRVAAAILMLAALAPSMSRLLGALEGHPTAFSLICSAAGAKPQQGAPADPSLAQNDCPACLIVMRDLLLPPPAADQADLLRADLSEAFGRVGLASAAPIAPRLSPPPRGPPPQA